MRQQENTGGLGVFKGWKQKKHTYTPIHTTNNTHNNNKNTYTHRGRTEGNAVKCLVKNEMRMEFVLFFPQHVTMQKAWVELLKFGN